MDGQIVRAERRRGLDGFADGIRNVVEFQVKEDFPARGADDVEERASESGKLLQADLENADAGGGLFDEALERFQGGTVIESERAVVGSRFFHGNKIPSVRQIPPAPKAILFAWIFPRGAIMRLDKLSAELVFNNDRKVWVYKPPATRAFKDVRDVAAFCAPLRSEGRSVVTTNGCFDILHSGHIRYLLDAAELGDILIVGVNADRTVARLKGPGRPIRNQDDRLQVVAALAMVDAAFIFHEDDPRSFLEAIRPDVHVKGGDYTGDLIERDTVERHGGRVAIVSYLAGFSTTSFVEKIKSIS